MARTNLFHYNRTCFNNYTKSGREIQEESREIRANFFIFPAFLPFRQIILYFSFSLCYNQEQLKNAILADRRSSHGASRLLMCPHINDFDMKTGRGLILAFRFQYFPVSLHTVHAQPKEYLPAAGRQCINK